uniref:Outer envelope protein 80ic-like n=1 Tax=Rhizophora mucronata TaxID=61149 RepID=A0A2P2KXX4_RHIMU
MGAQKSIHAGKAKIDVNVDFTHKLCASLMLLPHSRNTGSLLSLVIGRFVFCFL